MKLDTLFHTDWSLIWMHVQPYLCSKWDEAANNMDVDSGKQWNHAFLVGLALLRICPKCVIIE